MNRAPRWGVEAARGWGGEHLREPAGKPAPQAGIDKRALRRGSRTWRSGADVAVRPTTEASAARFHRENAAFHRVFTVKTAFFAVPCIYGFLKDLVAFRRNCVQTKRASTVF